VGSAPVFFRGRQRSQPSVGHQPGEEKSSNIRLAERKGNIFYELRMKPIEGTLNVSEIRLYITPRSYHIARIVTLNDYGR